MSKFKLIKEYPHSPKLGTVISRRTIGEDYWTYDNYTVVLLRRDTPENYPEFWEKVIEKDYEILSLKHYKINSVKRLSDGEIFTIGDKVQDSLTDILTGNKVQTINYFHSGDKLICQTKSGTTIPLSTIRKAEPILVTEEGVEICKGDSIYAVTNCFTLIYEPFIEFCSFNYSKYFAKKENAEKYIRDNEKRYSLNDIKETVNKLGCFGTTLIEYLEKNE